MGEVVEENSKPVTSRWETVEPPISEHHSVFLTGPPLHHSSNTTKSPQTLQYSEGSDHGVKLDPQDAWLPITESRNGNTYFSTFHILCSGIGIQALVLPVAFAAIGWTWGIICLSLAFAWQLYTIWILVQLHESASGTRYSRYLHLSIAAFGEKLGKLLAIFPVMYLSGGTCAMLIITGGRTMQRFFRIVCGNGATCSSTPLTGAEWYLIFVCLAIVVAQLPNLNSIAGVSLIGAITAVSYCTLIWVRSISVVRPAFVSYNLQSEAAKSEMARIGEILNALGIIALAFRGHNVVLEIQGTLPSSPKHPSHEPMWRGVKMSYLLIAMCLFPLAVGGYWAYGNKIHTNGGILSALWEFHRDNTSKIVMAITYLLVVINSLSSFQIYAMPVFDTLESKYTSRKNKRCPWWLRSGFRAAFGGVIFFVAVAVPFLGSLGALIGGITLPLTFAYPCFMWIKIKKPRPYRATRWLNLGLGCLGIVLSVLIVSAAVWNIVNEGIDAKFFKPGPDDKY